MDRITLTRVEVFAHHGALPHEREHGQRFAIDVVLEVDLGPAAASDDLSDTLDYGALVGQVADAAGDPPCTLIETVAARVADVCLADQRVHAVEVTVHKPAAPVPAPTADVAVTLRRVQRGGAA